MFVGERSYPERDGTLTFDKLSSVPRERQPQPRRPAGPPAHPAARTTRARDRLGNLCPAQVYEVGAEGEDGPVELEVTPSNCVQCGAITAKGGRLTPPEGGSGPEYSEM